MNCESVKKNAALFLYGELSLEEEQSFQDHIEACAECRQAFESEKRVHQALDGREMEPEPALLARCRRDLAGRIEGAAPPRNTLRQWLAGFFDLRVAALARPAGAVALVALGFFAARWTSNAPAGLRPSDSGADPVVTRVRYLQPDAAGKVQMMVEETRQRVLTGKADDDQIHRLLLVAARESSDPGLRAESMDLLKARNAAGEMRPVLLYALEHDPNPGIRLKALDALKPYGADSEVRTALAQVLLADDNPGVRAQAIDLLVQHKRDDTVGVLQEVVQKENNTYVRQRCQKALEEMNASVGTF
jgi:HEAT repeats/Putative zinc-finger